MNAAAERAFSERSDEVSRALWPGRVKIGGVEYPCSLVKTTLELEASDGSGAVIRVEGIKIEISKTLMTAPPEPNAIVKDLADDGLYLNYIQDGRMDNDTAWFLTCGRKP